MHLALAVAVVLFVWRMGAWREWQKFHPTMLYFAVGNLTYNFLTANHFLWKMKPDFFPNHSLTEMVYTFVVFPAAALLFLYNYPAGLRKVFWHYVRWIGVFVLMEWVFIICGRMLYQYGWNLTWSAVFDITMFPMLRLHYRRPLLAYGISVAMCVFWIWLFKVPVHIPIEQRGG